MAVGLARVAGGIGRSCDRDEGKAVLAGYVACPRVRTHDATVVPVMHEECRYLDLAEVEARQVYLEAAWLEGNPPNARSSASDDVRFRLGHRPLWGSKQTSDISTKVGAIHLSDFHQRIRCCSQFILGCHS